MSHSPAPGRIGPASFAASSVREARPDEHEAAQALIEGFNPEVALTRTQTIMEEVLHCDFRYQMRQVNDRPALDPIDK
jgi:hypothetical protein